METKIIEAKNHPIFNWGKFLVCRFDVEWKDRSALPENASQQVLLRQVGWDFNNLLIVDLQTGEGAIFRPGGYAKADLDKHQIWVCPLFEPFLAWLYTQDLSNLQALPACVNLGEVPPAMQGYRRPGPELVTVEQYDPTTGTDKPIWKRKK